MEVKFIAFYEEIFDKEKKVLKGSAHVYIVDLDMDLRGVDVLFEAGKAWITLPSQTRYDKEKQKDVRYPIIQFANREKTLILRKAVIKCVTKYINTNILRPKKKTRKRKDADGNPKVYKPKAESVSKFDPRGKLKTPKS